MQRIKKRNRLRERGSLRQCMFVYGDVDKHPLAFFASFSVSRKRAEDTSLPLSTRLTEGVFPLSVDMVAADCGTTFSVSCPLDTYRNRMLGPLDVYGVRIMNFPHRTSPLESEISSVDASGYSICATATLARHSARAKSRILFMGHLSVWSVRSVLFVRGECN